MTPEQKAMLDRLHNLQGRVQEHLQTIADRMGLTAARGINLAADKWEELFTNLQQTEKLAQQIGAALEQALKDAGVDVQAMQQSKR